MFGLLRRAFGARSPAPGIGAGLYESFIASETAAPPLPKMESGEYLPAFQSSLIRNKVQLYRKALVLMCLIAESRSSAYCETALREYERLILPRTPEAGTPILNELKQAMRDLSSLLEATEGDRRELSWAKAWFETTGDADEINPVDLALFASFWMKFFVAVTRTIRECAQLA